MTSWLKKLTVVAFVPAALVLAACAQQPLPEAHAAPMGSGGTMGMQSGANDQMSGMNGMMMQCGTSNQMSGMNGMMTMMTQMNQMMDRCNAMMQHETMHSSGAGDGSHQQ